MGAVHRASACACMQLLRPWHTHTHTHTHKHTHTTIAPETAAALPSCFSPGEAWIPIGGCAWVCPIIQMGQNIYWSAASWSAAYWSAASLSAAYWSAAYWSAASLLSVNVKLPGRNHVRSSGCNSAIVMMVAPENDGGPLQSPESPPLKS